MAQTLSASDVYDFYGLTVLSGPAYTTYKPKRLEILKDIRSKYIASLKGRIKAEAGYLGIEIDGDSIASIIKNVSAQLNSAIEAEAENMRRYDSKGFNIMKFVEQFHKQPTGMQTAPDAFRSKEGKARAMFGGEPWAKISEAFLKIESAQTDTEIILAIDGLNSLQHNTNYVLVDIAGVPGVDQLREMMEEKFHARGPEDLAPKMSPGVRSLLKEAGVL